MEIGKIAVETQSLIKKYNKQTVIDNLSMKIPIGGIYGLLGPNGAGKTTLMKMIAGLVRPDAGKLFVYGHDTADRDENLKKLIGLIPQDSNMEREFTVEESLKIYGRLFRIANLEQCVEDTIEKFNLQDMRKKIIRGLSGGMMRRVLIARCLMTDPQLVLLDEPTVGLDPDVRQTIWDIIQQLRTEGRTLIFTTHYMEEAQRLCDTIAIFRRGKLVLSDSNEHLQMQIGHDVKDLEDLFIKLSREGNS